MTETLRFIIHERDGRCEAECLDAAAAGVGETPFDAAVSLTRMLIAMADKGRQHGLSFRAQSDPADDKLFSRLESGEKIEGVVDFGHVTLKETGSAGATLAGIQELALAGNR